MPIKNPLLKYQSGRVEWKHEIGDAYLVTGVDRNGRRFSISTNSWMHADSINVYRGTVWLVRAGHRFVIRRVYN